MKFQIDQSSPVLVTGATGYVAGHIIKRLLEAGVTVHAAVRDPSRADKLKYLNEIAASTPGEINYFKSDFARGIVCGRDARLFDRVPHRLTF